MAPPNKIMIVVTGEPVAEIRSKRGDFVDIMAQAIGEAHRGEYLAFDAIAEQPPPIDDDTAIVITGSSANLYHREPWMLRTEAWLRETASRRIPTLGVCFGHQLLAQALGGDVQRNPRGREISTVDIEPLGPEPLLDGLGDGFRANACHSDSVCTLPPQAAVLARSDGDPHQIIRFAPACYGVQFHPEFDAEVMLGYVDARKAAAEAEGLDVRELTARAVDTPKARQIFHNFLHRIATVD